ncbi:MAG: PDZ domain-containing protein [Deltaproteobacteria bacterium]|nr:PDZ domain-containing protein [Deltaproteobacteria bacterium]
MIVTVSSSSSSLLRPLLLSLGALGVGFAISAMTVKPAEAPQPQVRRHDASAVLAFPSPDGRSDVRVALVVDDGRLAGLALAGVRPGSPWALAGLRDGDVIYGVDGDDVDDLARVLDVLSSSPRHTVSFTRNAQMQADVRINLSTLNP